MANDFRFQASGPEDPQRIAELEKYRYLRIGMMINDTTFTSTPITPGRFQEYVEGFHGLGFRFDFIEGLRKDGPTAGEWQSVYI